MSATAHERAVEASIVMRRERHSVREGLRRNTAGMREILLADEIPEEIADWTLFELLRCWRKDWRRATTAHARLARFNRLALANGVNMLSQIGQLPRERREWVAWNLPF